MQSSGQNTRRQWLTNSGWPVDPAFEADSLSTSIGTLQLTKQAPQWQDHEEGPAAPVQDGCMWGSYRDTLAESTRHPSLSSVHRASSHNSQSSALQRGLTLGMSEPSEEQSKDETPKEKRRRQNRAAQARFRQKKKEKRIAMQLEIAKPRGDTELGADSYESYDVDQARLTTDTVPSADLQTDHSPFHKRVSMRGTGSAPLSAKSTTRSLSTPMEQQGTSDRNEHSGLAQERLQGKRLNDRLAQRRRRQRIEDEIGHLRAKNASLEAQLSDCQSQIQSLRVHKATTSNLFEALLLAGGTLQISWSGATSSGNGPTDIPRDLMVADSWGGVWWPLLSEELEVDDDCHDGSDAWAGM